MSQRSPQTINTYTAWHPWLRPLARLLVGALLCNALAPLSVLAQDKGTVPISPLVQSQLRRAAVLQQDMQRAQAAKALSSSSTPATERSASNLSQAQALVRALLKSSSATALPVASPAPETAARTNPAPATAALTNPAPASRTPAAIAPATAIPALQASASALQSSQRQQLSALVDAIDADTDATLAEFHASRADLVARGLSAAILERHDQAEADLKTRAQTLRQRLSAFKASGSAASLAALGQYFDQYPAAKAHTPLDPSKLPWSTPKPTTRAPATTKTAWFQNLYADQRVQLAQATTIGGIQFKIPPEPGNAPTTADLATTPEVTLSPAIVAKAAALGNNPVAIHNWVRNTLQWQPTWGAIQSADSALSSLRGNAFDIASLEIALLRAAKIPARYQFGTIDLPAAQVQNWVGGVSKPEAALQLLNQGGIAAIGLTQAGVVQAIRMEHVWVQAYVNWSPSRGNRQGGNATAPKINTADGIAQHVNPNGPLNTWVALDGSFKQYLQTPKLGQVNGNTASCAKLVNSYNANILTNANSVQLLSGAFDASTNEDCTREVTNAVRESAIDLQQITRPTIVPAEHALLAGTLPYATVYDGLQTSALPTSMRWQVNVSLFDSELDIVTDNPSNVQTLDMASVSGKRLALSYQPATPSDAATLNKLRASGASSLPGYLITMVSELSLNGQVISTGTPRTMGSAQYVRVSINDNANQRSYASNSAGAVGDDMALVLNTSGMTNEVVQERFAKYGSSTSLENLNTAGLNYWLMVDTADAFTANLRQIAITRLPSLGVFASPVNVKYFFGIARSATYGTRYADVKIQMGAASGDQAANAAFLIQSGLQASNFEAATFERTFQKEIGSSYSATRLLNIAATQGIPIYKIDASNVQLVNTLQISQSAKDDITNAVATGHYAFAPEREPALSGWAAVGYIVIDPQTGAGAYLIDGGLSGGQDPGGCDNGTASAPVTDNVNATNVGLGLLGVLALAILTIEFLPYIIAAMVGGSLLFGTNVASAANIPPTGGLEPELQQIWDATYGRISGPFETGPNYPGDGVKNNCTAAQHKALEDEKDTACKGIEKCSGKDCDLAVVTQKIDHRTRCIIARLAVMSTCFNGGDAGHWIQVYQQLSGQNKCQKCRSQLLAKGNQCGKP